MINLKTLVLNIDYNPLMVIDWKDAITSDMLHKEIPELGLEVVKYYDGRYARAGGGKEFPIPSIMKTVRYVKKKKKVPLKKRNIYNRDKYTCGYCGKTLTDKTISIDHVISKHEWRIRKLPGSPHCWNNVISSCKSCNFKKGSLPLSVTGLKLMKQPYEPPYNEYLKQSLAGRSCPVEWKEYL